MTLEILAGGHDMILSLEYMAGFIDGDGCITLVHKNSKSLTPVVLIVNTNREIIVGFKFCFDELGIASYCNVEILKGNRKPVYKLSVQQLDSVHELLTLLYPHLKVKQKQAAIVLSYIERREDENFRFSDAFYVFADQCESEIRELNKRGK